MKDTQYEDGRPLFERVDQLFIDPMECIHCGACVPICPVLAIFAVDDLPEKWHSYIEKNSGYVEAGRFRANTGQPNTGDPLLAESASLADRETACRTSRQVTS